MAPLPSTMIFGHWGTVIGLYHCLAARWFCCRWLDLPVTRRQRPCLLEGHHCKWCTLMRRCGFNALLAGLHLRWLASYACNLRLLVVCTHTTPPAAGGSAVGPIGENASAQAKARSLRQHLRAQGRLLGKGQSVLKRGAGTRHTMRCLWAAAQCPSAW